MKTVAQLSRMTGLSARTIRYYDSIGLLTPTAVTDAGYRLYDESALERALSIMFYKELELSLEEIAELLGDPDADRRAVLKRHKKLLKAKKEHLKELISLIERLLEGEKMPKLKQDEKLREDELKELYAKEARSRWGDTDAYQVSMAHEASRRPEEESAMKAEEREIIAAFVDARGLPPTDERVQILVERWQRYITRYHYPCSIQMLKALGVMYIEDERFKAYFDAHGKYTARLISEAIKLYCENHS